ncbi:MAG: GatB/YqeY domain-containing protein [Acidobacteria bacterium]|nr:GatB/YqeY domain-containing protein [Acidobacteriota bacterium]
MAPRDKIQADVAAALKARDTARVSTLRLLISALDNERIARGREVDEAGFMRLVQKAIKQRKEAAELYDKGSRSELADKERTEAEILAAYLPPPIDEEEIRAAVVEFIDGEGLAGPQAIGRVMKEMMARFAGRADGGTINRIARELLL